MHDNTNSPQNGNFEQLENLNPILFALAKSIQKKTPPYRSIVKEGNKQTCINNTKHACIKAKHL